MRYVLIINPQHMCFRQVGQIVYQYPDYITVRIGADTLVLSYNEIEYVYIKRIGE